MPCLVALIALVAPRFAILLVVLFSDIIGEAYETTFWPLLGFFFMPLTTLAYAAAMHWNGSVTGGYFALVLVAALLDLGAMGGKRSRRFYRRVVWVRWNGRGGEDDVA